MRRNTDALKKFISKFRIKLAVTFGVENVTL